MIKFVVQVMLTVRVVSFSFSGRVRLPRGDRVFYVIHLHCILGGFNSAECLDAGILNLWHPTKNGDLRPSQVSDRTAKRIWLQCPTCGYEWRESLRGTRKESRKCPSCHGGREHYLAKGSNDLGSKRPDVARQLDPELNGGLRAEDLHAHAGAMVWWRGSCGHVWREKVCMRSMRVDDSCPYCKNRKLLRGFNDLAAAHPELAAEWDFGRNGDLGPDGVRFNATKQVWWRGGCGHEWRMSPRQRAVEGLGCPYCSGHRVLAGVFGNGFLDTLAARFRQSGKRTADVSDFCLPEHQGLVHPLARAVELDESSMVDHPVDHRGGKLVVAQDRSPFAELDVGGEHHASLLVAC